VSANEKSDFLSIALEYISLEQYLFYKGDLDLAKTRILSKKNKKVMEDELHPFKPVTLKTGSYLNTQLFFLIQKIDQAAIAINPALSLTHALEILLHELYHLAYFSQLSVPSADELIDSKGFLLKAAFQKGGEFEAFNFARKTMLSMGFSLGQLENRRTYEKLEQYEQGQLAQKDLARYFITAEGLDYFDQFNEHYREYLKRARLLIKFDVEDLEVQNKDYLKRIRTQKNLNTEDELLVKEYFLKFEADKKLILTEKEKLNSI
jgi:hypothetical protein